MKRILLWSLLVLVVLAVAIVSIVGVRAAEADPLPPPDPALPIELSDGSHMPLAEFVDRARRGLPRPVEPPTRLIPPPLELDGTLPANSDRELLDLARVARAVEADPVYALAEQSRADGKLDQALALYLSIPPDSRHYARARRLVAWNILARDMDQPGQAVQYADEALLSAPFDGNAWHDWARVYGRTLGLPID